MAPESALRSAWNWSQNTCQQEGEAESEAESEVGRQTESETESEAESDAGRQTESEEGRKAGAHHVAIAAHHHPPPPTAEAVPPFCNKLLLLRPREFSLSLIYYVRYIAPSLHDLAGGRDGARLADLLRAVRRPLLLALGVTLLHPARQGWRERRKRDGEGHAR